MSTLVILGWGMSLGCIDPVLGASPAQMALEQGMAALNQRNYAAAIQHFQTGLQANPHSISLYRALALAQQRSGDPSRLSRP
ncbi:MAG: hypothetical protein HC921_06130 [Synechococcaceae cyanobacterium SM2_3_1]|nr:hypothetical protein [Synechococcaceae cyanobacterium SM2_3_1]